MMRIDVLTIAAGLGSFAMFFFAHALCLRSGNPERVFRSLPGVMVSFLGLPAVLTAALFFGKVLDVSLSAAICIAVVASALHALLCFIYIFNVFGASATSIRMRLLREIAQAGEGGLSLEELLRRYNSAVITRLRLRRLVGAGYVVEERGVYRIGAPQNFFFWLDVVAGILLKGIGGRTGGARLR